MSSFDEFIAIDWSGATGRYDGIAAACCDPGKEAPRLERPPGAKPWTRTAVADWLDGKLKSGKRLLIGLDFAFAWPFGAGGYPGMGGATGADIFGLWDRIDAASGAEADFGCGSVVTQEPFKSLFWHSGTRPKKWQAGRRLSESACAETTGTRPESVFKLIGAKQVGKASLTGMRVLRHVRADNRRSVSVWPFERISGSVLVEIFPTLFRKSATGKLDKIRDRATLNVGLGHFGSSPYRDAEEAASDHNTDALISAAALRHLMAQAPALLSDCDDAHIRREGWIFGVPLPERWAA